MHNPFQQWYDLSTSTVAATQEITTINKNILLGLAKQQVNLLGICLEGGIKQMQALSSAREVYDIWAAQDSLTKDVGKQIMDNFRDTAEILIEGRNQLQNWFENAVQSSTIPYQTN